MSKRLQLKVGLKSHLLFDTHDEPRTHHRLQSHLDMANVEKKMTVEIA